MNNFILTLSNNLRESNTIKLVFVNAIVKVFGMGIGLSLSVFLARILIVEDFGVMNHLIKFSNIFVSIALLGSHIYVLKKASIIKKGKSIFNLIFSFAIYTSFISIILFVISFIFSEKISFYFFQINNYDKIVYTFFLGILPLSLNKLFSHGLLGYKLTTIANFILLSLSNVIAFIIIGVKYLITDKITFSFVVFTYIISYFITLLIILLYWKKKIGFERNIKLYKINIYKKTYPIFIVGISTIIFSNIDTLLIKNPSEMATYFVALRIAVLSSFFVQIIDSISSPKIASLFNKKDIVALKNYLKKIFLFLAFIGVLIIAVYIFFGTDILSLWGESYKESYLILIILSLSQFFKNTFSFTRNFLLMSNNEIYLSKLTSIYVFVGIILTYSLLSNFGVIGFACAILILEILMASIQLKKTIDIINA